MLKHVFENFYDKLSKKIVLNEGLVKQTQEVTFASITPLLQR